MARRLEQGMGLIEVMIALLVLWGLSGFAVLFAGVPLLAWPTGRAPPFTLEAAPFNGMVDGATAWFELAPGTPATEGLVTLPFSSSCWLRITAPLGLGW